MLISELVYRMDFPAYFAGLLIDVRFNESTQPLFISTSPGGNVELNPAVISIFEKRTGLHFDEMEMDHGNVCFANREEVRTDFRTVFSLQELLECVFAMLQLPDRKWERGQLHYPDDGEHFWDLVYLGRVKKLQTEKFRGSS